MSRFFRRGEKTQSPVYDNNGDPVDRDTTKDFHHDQEKGVHHGPLADATPAQVGAALNRGLKNRHIQMIAIGGVIGTGLFLGTANALRHGGPCGMLLGYTVMGTICWSVMIALGEMIALLPIAGGHITLATRFVDEALGFTMGWNYWYNWTIVLPAELSAAAVLVNYWNDSISNAAWISIFLVVVVAVNFAGAAVYGEFEFWFASIKVLTIVGLIICGIVIDLGGAPKHDRLGFRYWHHPGPFVQYLGIGGAKGRFLGFWKVLIQAAFSYIGTEIVAIAAGEAKNPRRNIPKAIKRVYIRICIFYILGTFVIGLITPSDDPRLKLGSGTAAASPWVIGIQNAGIKVLPSLINACLLTSAWSAANSDLYTSSRALLGLALNHQAPRFLARITKHGLPIWCVVVGTAFSLLSYMNVSNDAGKVFNWFANMTAVAGLQTWIGILFTYIRFHHGLKAQGIDRSTLPYRAPLQPWVTYYGFFMVFIVLIFNAYDVFIKGEWDTATFVTSYLPLPLFLILLFGWKFIKRTHMIRLDEMDFHSNVDEFVVHEDPDKPPKNIGQRIWSRMF